MRAGEYSAAKVAIGSGSGKRERGRIEPLPWIALNHRTGERCVERRPVRVASVAIAGPVRPNLRRERKSAQGREDAVQFPAAGDVVQCLSHLASEPPAPAEG